MTEPPIPIDETGRFSGYASLFGRLDQGGDIVMPGAFKASLAARGAIGIRMLFQHDPKEPVGIWEVIREDRLGLFVSGRLLPGVPRSDALRRLISGRAIDGLSIGFRARKSTRDPAAGARRLWQIDLWEISIVTFPMMDGARIEPPATGVGDAPRLARSLDAAISLLRN